MLEISNLGRIISPFLSGYIAVSVVIKTSRFVPLLEKYRQVMEVCKSTKCITMMLDWMFLESMKALMLFFFVKLSNVHLVLIDC